MAKLPNGYGVFVPPQFNKLSTSETAVGVHSETGKTIYKKIIKVTTPSSGNSTTVNIGKVRVLDCCGMGWYSNTSSGKQCQFIFPYGDTTNNYIIFGTGENNNVLYVCYNSYTRNDPLNIILTYYYL